MTSEPAHNDESERSPAEAARSRGRQRRSREPVRPTDLLRQALVDDRDPRFPRWLPLPGAAAAVGWAAFHAVAMDGAFLATLAWPGAAIFALTTLAAWFGWQLEID